MRYSFWFNWRSGLSLFSKYDLRNNFLPTLSPPRHAARGGVAHPIRVPAGRALKALKAPAVLLNCLSDFWQDLSSFFFFVICYFLPFFHTASHQGGLLRMFFSLCWGLLVSSLYCLPALFGMTTFLLLTFCHVIPVPLSRSIPPSLLPSPLACTPAGYRKETSIYSLYFQFEYFLSPLGLCPSLVTLL